MATHESDLALVQAVIAGQELAWLQLVKQCGGCWDGIACKHQLDPDDFIGELYAHLADSEWRRLRSYRSQQPLIHWLAVVARHLAEDLREAAAHTSLYEVTEADLRDTEPESFDLLERLRASGEETDPFAAAFRSELAVILDDALAALHDPACEYLLRREYFQEEAIQDAAAQLGLNRNTAYSLKHRNLKHLRAFLCENYPDMDWPVQDER
jgi:RNA polymerase sigma factor (sigma-70 family)